MVTVAKMGMPSDDVSGGRHPNDPSRPNDPLESRIAERTRAIEAEIAERRRTEERFRLVIEACPSGMLIADQSGAIQLVNAKIEQMFGYSRDELLGRSVDMLVPHKFRGGHRRNREHYFDAPETRAMGVGRDLRGVRKDGTEFPVEIGLNPIHTDDGILVLSVVVDITERPVAEEKFRLAGEACPSGMLIADEAGRIILVNAKIEQMFGYDRADLLGHSVDMLVPQKYRTAHVHNRESYYRKPETRAMGAGRDLRAVRRDGTEFPVEIGLNPINTREGILVLGVIVDITERRAAQEAIAKMNAELEERVRARTSELTALNAELESFAYAVSHDLRAPIRAMDGFSQALIEDYAESLDDTATDYLNRIRAGSQRMGNLIDGLLKLSRVARAELKKMRLPSADQCGCESSPGVSVNRLRPDPSARTV